jgi:hypothetical protein
MYALPIRTVQPTIAITAKLAHPSDELSPAVTSLIAPGLMKPGMNNPRSMG